MDAFATVKDLEQRYGDTLNPSECDQAEILLEDAAAFLELEFRRCHRTIDEDDELLMYNLKVVSCSMVKRSMAAATNFDLTQISVTAGSFNEQKTFANPSGDMYLTAQERRLLGLPKHCVNMKFIMPGSRSHHEG